MSDLDDSWAMDQPITKNNKGEEKKKKEEKGEEKEQWGKRN